MLAEVVRDFVPRDDGDVVRSTLPVEVSLGAGEHDHERGEGSVEEVGAPEKTRPRQLFGVGEPGGRPECDQDRDADLEVPVAYENSRDLRGHGKGLGGGIRHVPASDASPKQRESLRRQLVLGEHRDQHVAVLHCAGWRQVLFLDESGVKVHHC